MITVNAFYTAENTQDVVEMGMITYSSKVSTWSVATAEHIIPGATYVESTGRYYSSSQGIHAKYLGDAVYLAVYAKLADGTLAGSCTDLFACMRLCMGFGIPEVDAVRAATINPALSAGVSEHCGSIATGKPADFIVCRPDYLNPRVFLGGNEL